MTIFYIAECPTSKVNFPSSLENNGGAVQMGENEMENMNSVLLGQKTREKGLYRKLSAPISAQVEITAGCNNSCLYCYNHWRENGKMPSKSLSLKDLEYVGKELVASQVFTVTLTGGEPLLVWKRLPKIIDYLKSAAISVSLNSNLTLITPEIACALKESGLEAVLTSVLSHNENIHDQLSNRKGAWRQTVKGIETAIAHGLCVNTNMVLLKQNHKSIYETAQFLASIGVHSFSATKASPSLNSRNFNDLRLSIKELRASLDMLETVKEELRMNVDILECYPLCLLSDLNKFWHYGRRNCTAGVTTLTIGSDGNVRPCSHSDMHYGNIFKEGMLDIFNKMGDWRDGKYIPDNCKRCGYLKMCSGGCRMEAKYLGNICEKDPYMTSPDDIIPKSADASKTGEVSLNQKYSLKPGFRWREEEFGAVVSAPGSYPILINKDGHDVMKRMSSSPLSIEEMPKEINSETEWFRKFFLHLLQCRLIFPVQQERR